MWKTVVISLTLLVISSVAEMKAQQCTPIPSGITFYFPYDGVWSDRVNNVPASQVGSVGTIPDPWNRSGPHEAIRITTSTYLEFPDHPALDVDTLDFTVDGWVRIIRPQGSKVLPIIDKRLPRRSGYMVYLRDNRIGLQTVQPPHRNIESPQLPALSDGEWHFVAVTVDRRSRNATLYLDGQVVGTSSSLPASSVSLSNDENAWVGRGHESPNERGEFDVDEIEVFKRVLSQQEIVALARLPKCREIVPPRGDIGVTKTFLNEPWTAGGTATFEIEVTPTGMSIPTGFVVVDDVAPATLLGVSASPGAWTCPGSPYPDNLCEYTGPPTTDPQTITVEIKVPNEDVYGNCAAIDPNDSNGRNDRSCVRTRPLPSKIVLGPPAADNPVGTTHTVTAQVEIGGQPQAGVLVTFTVTSGPHAGTTATALTDASGTASMTYPGSTPGTDEIQATATVQGPGPPTKLSSNVVTKTWIEEETECCAELSVKPFPLAPANTDMRTFTVSNPLKERICWLEIQWLPNKPNGTTGGGPANPGVIIDGEVETSVGLGQWFSPNYLRLPPSGNIDLGPILGSGTSPGAEDFIAFNLGVDVLQNWSGSIRIVAHYCDGSECDLTFGPWTPGLPEQSDAVSVAGTKSGAVNTLRLDASESQVKPKWVAFTVEEGRTLLVSGGEVRSRGRRGQGMASMTRFGLRSNSAMFELPASTTTADFDVLVTGRSGIATVHWTTYDANAGPIQTGHLELEGRN